MSEVDKELAQIRLIEREVQAYSGQAEMMAQSLQGYRKAIETVEAIPDLGDGDELLVPIGGGIILRTSWTTGTKVMVDIGAGVVVEEDADSARTFLDSRVREMEAALTRIDQHLNQLKAQYAALSQKVQGDHQEPSDVQDPA